MHNINGDNIQGAVHDRHPVPEEIMEQERDNTAMSAQDSQDVLLSFSADAEKTEQTAAAVDESLAAETAAASRMAIGSRKKQADFMPFAEPILLDEEAQELDDGQSSVLVVHEAEADPEPTAKQIRKAERNAKKQAKQDKKYDKRKAKVQRQQKNNTRIMLGGTIFLALICAVLLFMHHYNLTFMDIPDVLSGEMELTLEPPTVPLHIAEPTEAGPVAPAKGNYVVSSDEGVYLRENATTESTRLAALQKGTQLSIGAFKYDAANESFWGRTSADGMYGWVIMSALSPVETQEPTAAAAADSIG